MLSLFQQLEIDKPLTYISLVSIYMKCVFFLYKNLWFQYYFSEVNLPGKC